MITLNKEQRKLLPPIQKGIYSIKSLEKQIQAEINIKMQVEKERILFIFPPGYKVIISPNA